MWFGKNKEGQPSNVTGYRSYEIIRESEDQTIKISFDKLAMVNIGSEEVVADQVLVDDLADKLFELVRLTKSKYIEIPKEIGLYYNKDAVESKQSASTDQVGCDKNDTDQKEKETLLNAIVPQWTMDDIYLPVATRQQISTTMTILNNKDKLFKEWGIKGSNPMGRAVVLNFFGPPGTGKTMGAEAIAHSLGKKVCLVNYAELESKYVGDTPKNISRIFAQAKETDAVIVFDEADSFLGKRLTSVTQAADYGVNVTRSVMLMEIERFDGIIIFTTNLISNYDEAFKRRILANIEFKLPDLEGRERIWETHLPKTLPVSDEVTPALLAKEFENISGADIKDIVLYAAVHCLEQKNNVLSLEDFRIAHQYIQNRYQSQQPQNVSITSRTITQEEYEKIQKESDANNE